MDSIVIHPTDANILYASGLGGGVYKSTDAGQTWILKRIAGVHASQPLFSLVIDPVVPDTLYVLGSSGVWKTTDSGNSWQLKNNGIHQCHFPPHRNLQALTMDPINSNTLYVGTHTSCPSTVPGALYKTSNGGDSWADISDGLNMPAQGGVSALDVTGLHVYVGVYDYASLQKGRLYHSSDGGATWSEVNFGQPADTYIFSVFVNPMDAKEVWVGLHSIYNWTRDQVLFMTTDGGSTWNLVSNFPRRESVRILGKSPSDVLYVSSYMTSDNGLTWDILMEIYGTETTGGLCSIAFSPDDDATLYVALRCGSGMAKSTDGGRTWHRINRGITNTGVSLLAPHPIHERLPSVK